MKTEKILKSDLWTTQSWKNLLICWISNQKVESVIKKLNVVEFAFGWEQLCGSYQFYNKILTMVENFWKLTMQHAGTISKDWFIVKNSKEFPWITRQRESNWRREVVDSMYSCGEPSWWKGFYLCLSLSKKPKINSSRNTVHFRCFSVCVCVCVCIRLIAFILPLLSHFSTYYLPGQCVFSLLRFGATSFVDRDPEVCSRTLCSVVLFTVSSYTTNRLCFLITMVLKCALIHGGEFAPTHILFFFLEKKTFNFFHANWANTAAPKFYWDFGGNYIKIIG